MSDGRRRYDDWTDAELMVAVVELDDLAFQALYRRHAAAAFALARFIVRGDAGPEDVVQDAFLSVWRGGGRYDPSRGSVRTWLLTVVRHRSLDALRRDGSWRQSSLDVHDATAALTAPGLLPDAQAVRAEDGHSVRMALPSLPDEQRVVVELAYYRGLSHNEIAQQLKVPLGTVKGRMRLALVKLRGLLDATGARP